MAKSRRWSSRLAAAWRRLIRNQQMALSVLAVVIGAASAYGAIGFRLAIDAIQLVFYGSPSEQVYSMAVALEWWHLLLAPAVGGLGIGLFVHFVMADRRPLGVAEVIEAGALRGGRMRLRDGIGAAIVSAASVGAGASVGREGPVVHLAATMASWVAQRLSLSRSMTMTLLGCAVASGVAASFNAPIAGVFFALEVVVGHYGLGAFAPVVVASVVGETTLVPISTDQLVFKQITVKYVYTSTAPAGRTAVQLIESRNYPFEQMVTHRFPLQQAEQAIQTVAGQNSEAYPIKVVLTQ